MDAEENIGRTVIDLAVKIHRDLGPGLLESVYEVILAEELRRNGLMVERQVPIAIEYCGIRFTEGFRIDILVEDKVIIELKCVETLALTARKQLLTYLRMSNRKLGYLLNFGAPVMKEGIIRAINSIPRP